MDPSTERQAIQTTYTRTLVTTLNALAEDLGDGPNAGLALLHIVSDAIVLHSTDSGTMLPPEELRRRVQPFNDDMIERLVQTLEIRMKFTRDLLLAYAEQQLTKPFN